MGTFYEVTLAAEVSPAKTEQVQGGLDDLLLDINREMSTYDPDSEISRFNKSESTDWFEVSPRFAFVVEQSLKICETTDGAFDPTVAPLVNLWHFGPEIEDRVIPSDEQVKATLAKTGYENLEVRLDPPALRKSLPGLQLDLSAVAKGFAVDAVGQFLISKGFESHLINIGGEMVGRGRKQDGTAWRVAIERPVELGREIAGVLLLENRAVATSGDYRNFYEVDGQRYSHTIDPKTGHPVTHALRSASVLCRTCLEADAYATAMMVLGYEAGRKLADEQDLEIYLIRQQGDELEAFASPGFSIE